VNACCASQTTIASASGNFDSESTTVPRMVWVKVCAESIAPNNKRTLSSIRLMINDFVTPKLRQL
jgi:hypothetical protein